MSDDTVAINVGQWTQTNAEFTDAAAEESWANDEMVWGVWHTPLEVLGDVDGLDVVELGCGTAFFSARLARRGARPVGVDPTPAQLETARRMQAQTGLEFPLVEAPGEAVPLADSSFDLVLSEYGASLWADPYKWIPEAARLLRPGGRLVFLRNSHARAPAACPTRAPGRGSPASPAASGCARTTGGATTTASSISLSHGDWIALLREHGFEIVRLIELQAPATTR